MKEIVKERVKKIDTKRFREREKIKLERGER
jgi:hypothetical protein